MKMKILAKFSRCFWLLLAASFLMLHSSFVGNAQNDSALNLAGTEWVKDRVTIPNGFDNSVITVLRYYAFDKQGKLKSTVLTVKSPGLKYENVYDYNPATRRYEYRYKYVPTPSESNSNVLDGTYKISGRSIFIDLPDCAISANIDGDFMRGFVTYKENNRKEEWLVKTTNQPTSINNSNQNSSNGRNSEESLNKSMPLSMKERLPERIGQFQRTFFSQIEAHLETHGKKQSGGQNGFDTTGFTAAGVESAWAEYGKIRVQVTRFEYPIEATKYLQDDIRLNSSLIVKRVPVKNYAGESVGELVVIQDLQKQSASLNEVVAFTYGAYFYWIDSPDLGEAQKIQKLLTLE